MVLTPATRPSVPYGFMACTLSSFDTGREDLLLVYTWVCTLCRYHLKVDSCSITAPFLYILKGKSSQWPENQAVYLVEHFSQKEKWPDV
jgi:hypothetical protein